MREILSSDFAMRQLWMEGFDAERFMRKPAA